MNLDEQIAERLFGWERYVSADHTSHPKLRDFGIIYGWRKDGKNLGLDVPHFSDDPALVRAVEDEIERRELQNLYAYALADVLNIGDGWRYEGPGGSELWALIRATPEQRCRAALKALEER